jgi:hypothetical protein
MSPLHDMILVATASVGVLLIAAAPAETQIAQQQRPPASVRELCEDDVAKFCADAARPQKVRACMQGNAKQLKPACRSALETAGILAK